MSSRSPGPRPVPCALALASVLAPADCGGEQPEQTGTVGVQQLVIQGSGA